MKNDAIKTYLTSLQGKVFKLLPMREAYDEGSDVHLYEYLDNLRSSYMGALLLYPELGGNKHLVEVGNNIAFLLSKEETTFKKWRSTVLRSTRLIQFAIDGYNQEV